MICESRFISIIQEIVMKQTEIVFILDRSGSMSGLETDTIGGYNSMLKKQQLASGEAFVTTVLFDDEHEVIHNRVNINEILPISESEYFVRGSTALLDAVGKSVNNTINAIKNTEKAKQPQKVMFVIITDGMENSSSEYTYKKVKKLIDHQKKQYDWEFIFLGANIDAIATAAQFGIDEDRAVNYNADSEGTKLNYEVVSELIVNMRSKSMIDENWKDKIDEDYNRRKK